MGWTVKGGLLNEIWGSNQIARPPGRTDPCHSPEQTCSPCPGFPARGKQQVRCFTSLSWLDLNLALVRQVPSLQVCVRLWIEEPRSRSKSEDWRILLEVACAAAGHEETWSLGDHGRHIVVQTKRMATSPILLMQCSLVGRFSRKHIWPWPRRTAITLSIISRLSGSWLSRRSWARSSCLHSALRRSPLPVKFPQQLLPLRCSVWILEIPWADLRRNRQRTIMLDANPKAWFFSLHRGVILRCGLVLRRESSQWPSAILPFLWGDEAQKTTLTKIKFVHYYAKTSVGAFGSMR